MDNHPNQNTEPRAGGDPDQRSASRYDLYAARLTSPEVRRARETRQRAEQYATRGIVPFGRRPTQRTKRPRRTLIASVAALTTIVGGGSAALASQAVYQIQPGDTLSEVAEAHGTTINSLAAINDIADPDLIVTGDSLLIPSEAQTGTQSTHTVVWGDTLSEIAALHGTTLETLMELNGISDPDLIVVGDVLLISTTAEDATDSPDVTVQETGEVPTDDVDPSDMSDDNDDEHGSVDDPEAIDGESSDDTSDSETVQVSDSGDTGSDEAEETDSGSVENDDVVTDPADGDTTATESELTPVEVEIAALHLVTDGETLESIATLYGISVNELIALNEQAQNGVTAGMILAIPEGASSDISADDLPDDAVSPSDSIDAAALATATAYWGGEIPQEDTLAALNISDSTLDAYSSVLERYGYHPGIFDSGAGTETLTAQVDAGFPVIAWVDDGQGYRAILISGYDDADVLILDVVDGSTYWLSWDTFISAWDAGGGVAIAIAPL